MHVNVVAHMLLVNLEWGLLMLDNQNLAMIQTDSMLICNARFSEMLLKNSLFT